MKSNFQRLGFTILASTVFSFCTFFLHAEGKPVRVSYNLTSYSRDVDANAVNKRAVRDFQRSYPAVANANWYHTEDGGWLAIFDDGAIRTVVAYNRIGALNHTIKYFDESKLPKDVRSIARSTYYDFKINRVANIILPDPQANEVYLVYMESESELKVVTISGREIVDVKTFQKGG